MLIGRSKEKRYHGHPNFTKSNHIPTRNITQHCAQCGIDIYRFDHHCIWLANCVGGANHGRFILFLCLHLLSVAIFLAHIAGPYLHHTLPLTLPSPLKDASQVLRSLCLRPVFPLLLQALFAMGTALGLTLLLAGHVRGVLENITTNERLNGKRYAWMQQDPRTGRLRSRFDCGWRMNVLEFCGVWGAGRDYKAVFELPAVGASAVPVEAAAGPGMSDNNVDVTGARGS